MTQQTKARQTRQREAIQEALEEAVGPVQPPEVLRMAAKRGARLSLATVYRNLKERVAKGEVKLVELPGEAARFELAGKGHHHYFSCRCCARVFDLESCVRQGLRTLIPQGFELEDHEIVLYGRCPSCSR